LGSFTTIKNIFPFNSHILFYFTQPHFTMANNTDTPRSLFALKAAVTGTTLFIAGGMASTSIQFIPALVYAAQKAPSRPDVKRAESGRLTPQISESKQLSHPAPGSFGGGIAFDGYRGAAAQFATMSKTAFVTQVPPELLSILASGYLAYHSYNSGAVSSAAGHKWAAVAALIAAIFPLTGGFMVPIDHKLAQLGGAEEKVEPYEDMPPDRGAERLNTVKFLGQWSRLNQLRSLMMFAAGGLGLWGMME
jgi:hypothetical protein